MLCVRTYVRTLPNFTTIWKRDHTKVKRKLCLNFGWKWSGHSQTSRTGSGAYEMQGFFNLIYLTVYLRPRNLPMKAAPYTELPEIHLLHQSILTTYYHTDTMLNSSLDVLHILWCRLVCRNSVELNFVKTGLKCKLGVNPQSFSHELCLYITRFVIAYR